MNKFKLQTNKCKNNLVKNFFFNKLNLHLQIFNNVNVIKNDYSTYLSVALPKLKKLNI